MGVENLSRHLACSSSFVTPASRNWPAYLQKNVSAPFQFVDNVTDLQRRAQLQPHVFHHHIRS